MFPIESCLTHMDNDSIALSSESGTFKGLGFLMKHRIYYLYLRCCSLVDRGDIHTCPDYTRQHTVLRFCDLYKTCSSLFWLKSCLAFRVPSGFSNSKKICLVIVGVLSGNWLGEHSKSDCCM